MQTADYSVALCGKLYNSTIMKKIFPEFEYVWLAVLLFKRIHLDQTYSFRKDSDLGLIEFDISHNILFIRLIVARVARQRT